MSLEPSTRHLPAGKLLEHWDGNVPVLVPLHGSPELRLLVSKPAERLTLRVPVSPNETIPSNPLEHVDVQLVVEAGKRFLEVSITDERLLLDGYAMLTTVADRVQLEGKEPTAALAETLTRWRTVLALRTRLTPEREVGLFGELLVVDASLQGGLDPEMRAWRGALSEEHDFGLGPLDIEVKTTSGERREHWIHGVGQLMPTKQRPLWLLSVQLTRAGTGGETLPEIVARVIQQAGGEGAERLRAGIESAGFREEQADLFEDHWRLRTAPLAARVDQQFPRITPDGLKAAGIRTERIRDLRYQVDLTDYLPATSPQPPLSHLLKYLAPDAA